MALEPAADAEGTASPAATPRAAVWRLIPNAELARILALALVASFADSATVFLLYALGTGLTGTAAVTGGLSGSALGLLDGWAEVLGVDPLLVTSALFLLSILVRHALRIVLDRRIIAVQFDVLQSLSGRLLHGYLRLPYETFVERHTVDRINSMTNEASRAGTSLNGFIRFTTQALNLLLLVLLLLAVQWQAFAFAVVAGALLWTIVRPLSARNRAVGRKVRGATQDLWTAIVEPFRAYRVIVTSDAHEVFERDVERKMRRNLDLMRQLTYNQQKVAPLMELTIGAMIFAGILLALYTTANPEDAFPIVLLAISGSYRILPTVSALNASYTSYRTNEPALRHVLQELDDMAAAPEPPGLHRAPATRDGSLLALERVSFRYRKGGDVLHDVDLAIRPGERIGIVGPSGSGKSTLIDLLLGLLRPSAGEVLNGRRPDGGPIRVGYVPQQLALIDGTVLDNVCLGEAATRRDRARAQGALDQVGLGAGSRQPLSLDQHVGEGGLRLSGGQRQRLGIARALYRDPDLLLLDEPTASLDAESEAQVVAALAALPGLPILIVTHRERPLKLCSRVLRIEGGRLIPAIRQDGPA